MENDQIILAAVADHAAKFEAKTKALDARLAEHDQLFSRAETVIDGMLANGTGLRAKAANSLASDFIKSEALARMVDAGLPTTGRVALKSASIAALRTKAVTTSGRGASGDDGYNVQAQRDAGLYANPMRALMLLDVLPTIEVASSVFEYTLLDGYLNAAAVQAVEGTQKAKAAVPTKLVQAQIATVAHWLPASLQVLSDAPALAGQLNNLLSYGVSAKLEDLLINGPGGAGNVTGLLAGSTAYAATASGTADKIGEAATSLASAGWAPSTVLMNPADWFAVASLKNTGDGAYQLGSPRDPTPATLWGLPVILSPSLAAGTALVFDASQMALLDRQQVTLAASREDGNNFTSNLVTILAECRAGLAVFSPSAILSVALA